MATIGLLLKPLDVLLFRDARAFEPGDTGRTQWPTPATFSGLVKTHITRRYLNNDSSRWHGHHDKPESDQPWHVRLKFRGPWLFVEDSDQLDRWNAAQGRSTSAQSGPLVAAPADIVRLARVPLLKSSG